MSTNELIERLRTLATKEHGFGMRYDNSGFSPSLHLYGKRAVAAYWLLSNGHTSADLLASQAAEIKRLREALEPFAQAASTMATWAEDHHRLSAYPGHTQGLTAGDLRCATQALKGTGADHG